MGTIVNSIRSTLAQHHLSKPIWNTETNWLPPFTLTSELGAAYLVLSMVLARAAGLARFIWYQCDNHDGVTVEMVSRDNTAPTFVAEAFTRLQDWLTGNTL